MPSGEPPDWLTEVKLPAALERQFEVYEVSRPPDAIAQARDVRRPTPAAPSTHARR